MFALVVPTSMETARVAYLFNPAGIRVDQVGYAGGPILPDVSCYARCPDGAGPSNGHNYLTSGGGTTWLVLQCSMGTRNIFVPGCYTSSVGEENPREAPWGGLKRSFLLR